MTEGPILTTRAVGPPAAPTPATPANAAPSQQAPTDAYGYDVPRPQPTQIRPAPGPALAEAKRPRGAIRTWVIFGSVFGILALTALAVWIYAIQPYGVGTVLVAGTAALVPFLVVLAAIWWLDRYTPQPRITLVYAFTWGAVGSIALSLAFGTVANLVISLQTDDPTAQLFLSIAVQAPIVEEATKAFGLVLLLLFGRRYISGPIDGVIYAMLIAAGFAFTENITYFSRALAAAHTSGAAGEFWEVFFLRGVMSPFAHASFTALVGLGLGIAAERRSLLLYASLGLGGLGAGMALHALWNGGSMWVGMAYPDGGSAMFYIYYLIVEVPIFLVLGAVLIGLRLRERVIVRRRLSDYGRAGWFTPAEVDMLERLRSRRTAQHWADSYGAVAGWAMKDFQRTALRLAAHRQAALSGGSSTRIRATEAELLENLTAARRTLSALTLPVVPLQVAGGAYNGRAPHAATAPPRGAITPHDD
ncbi:MAG: PrsW family intramembrane metalloprotease [Dermabacter sp.]|nr:PrsW family intramembrane metalloprotease [Dermabacter sp.]